VFDYSYEAQDLSGEGTEKIVKIEHDIILIASDLMREDMVRVRLAVSHSMAQNVKLSSFESAIEGTARLKSLKPAANMELDSARYAVSSGGASCGACQHWASCGQ